MSRDPQRHRMQRAIFEARRRILPVAKHELDDIVGIWVETALGLSAQDLRLMGRLVAAQDRRIAD
jgi:DSF synthase